MLRHACCHGLRRRWGPKRGQQFCSVGAFHGVATLSHKGSDGAENSWAEQCEYTKKVMALRVGRFVTPKCVLVCEQVRLRLRVRARSHRGSPTRAHTQGMELKIGGERCFMMGNAVACFLSWSAASLGPATRAAILQRRRVSRGCHTFAQRLGWS